MTENTIRYYPNRDECIDGAIISAIQAGGAVSNARLEYDVDAIADEVIDSEMHGTDLLFFRRPDVDFWAIVWAHGIADGDYRILWEESGWAGSGFEVARLLRWSSDEEDFIEIDSERIERDEDVAPYRDAEEALETRHGLRDVNVVPLYL